MYKLQSPIGSANRELYSDVKITVPLPKYSAVEVNVKGLLNAAIYTEIQ